MTDRELLELAAKAVGIPLKPDFAERFDYYMSDRLMWNPLTDDGDALRLALRCGIDIVFDVESQLTEAHYVAGEDGWLAALWRDDKSAATRRAIVRAAAEIGKAML